MKNILIILLSLLLLPSISYAGKWHTNMKKQEKKDFERYVLKAQSKNKMVFNTRNAPNKNGLYKFFDNQFPVLNLFLCYILNYHYYHLLHVGEYEQQ